MSELAIAVAMGIDKQDNKYEVSVQVVQPGEVASKKGNGSSTSVTMYKARAATVYEAIRKMTTDSPRKIYAAHLRILVIGEDLAREGVGKVLDLLSRDYELQTDFYIVVAKGTTAANTLHILTPLEKTPANKMYGSIDTSEKAWAPTSAITLNESGYVSDGIQPVLGGIRVVGDPKLGRVKENVETIEPRVRLVNSGLAVFRNDRLIGWLNDKQSKGYNYIMNHVKSTVGKVTCPHGGQVALEVLTSKAEIKASVHNGTPRILIELSVEENIGDVECRIDLTQTDNIHALEQEAEEVLEQVVMGVVEAAQTSFHTDIFGFDNAVHRADPQAWKSLKENWDHQFARLDVRVNAKVKIKRMGTVSNSFFEKAKE